MKDREYLIGALLSEAAGLLEQAAGLAPLSEAAGAAQRIERIEYYTRNASALIAAAKVMTEYNKRGD